MFLTVVYPDDAHRAYRIAAEEFASFAKRVAGVQTQIAAVDQYQPANEDLTVLIGNDAVNPIVADLYLAQKTDRLGIRYGTDDYLIRTLESDGKQYMILAGGRPRSAIYAVYRYFELYCGCRWFWDGDRVPNAPLPVSGIDLVESPRFEYRGLRYFAHRSLHRFQAEQWSFEDWKAEIDWLLKKRLNLFMLRIGMDDVFQKAFPETVSYPDRDQPLPGAGEGYDDRTLFWSLQYRGELRKKILQYAFERDLMHPEDCGTMTHWYSRTPLGFLETKKPPLLPQSNRHYNDPTGRVWDIRYKENFDNYFKLTETHIKEYGKPELFHTIGLGERRYSTDREANKRMKLYVYHKIASRIQEQYPNAPLLIASWDLWMQFTPDEVRDLVAELNPEQAVIFDYTSDTMRENNFTQWGILHKFPWVFGIFGGYEANSEIRGFYDLANERLKLAKDDPMCKGFILWAEFSHGDPFAIEYTANNAWDREMRSVSEQIDKFCADRYPKQLAAEMTDLWHKFMPIVQLNAWSVDGTIQMHGQDIFPHVIERAEFKKEKAEQYREKIAPYVPCQQAAVGILKRLPEISAKDNMTERDLYDIARTVVGRYLNVAIRQAEWLYAVGKSADQLEKAMSVAEGLMNCLVQILGTHEDYSLLASLRRLQSVAETNPNFEKTLKNNAENSYCRSYIYENAAYLYLPEMKLLFDTVRKSLQTGTEYNSEMLTEEAARIRSCYFETPLTVMKRDCGSFADSVQKAAEWIGQLAIENA